MRSSLLTTAFALFSIAGICQDAVVSCCAPNATELYARNASDKNFQAMHDLPLPYKHISQNGADITFKAADGTDAHGWEIKAKTPSKYYLFVFHEWWGLNDHIKKETEKMWNDLGINVLDIDLYDKKIASTQQEAAKYMQALTTERAQNIIKGAYAYVGKNAKVFTLGWCFGGGWSLQAALIGGSQLVGCVMFYGQPEKDIEKLKSLNADVIGFFGNKDQWPSPAMVDEFVANMKKAGKKLTVYRYDATHAFANPSNPNFNKEATEDSYSKLVPFIKERIR